MPDLTVVQDVAGPAESESSGGGGGVVVRLTIDQIALSDYSKYVCRAVNAVGSTNATVLVRVKGHRIASLLTYLLTQLLTRISLHTYLSTCAPFA